MTTRLAVLALVVIAAVHIAAVVHELPRPVDHDEAEHLRAAAWMGSGKTIYRDFVENHTPFLYQLLAPLAPAHDAVDALRAYVIRARLLSALAGTLAALCVALIAVRASGQLAAAVPVLAALLAPGWTSMRAVLDVRAEPYTLLLFWAGALLILQRGRPLLSGLGAGLVCAAAVWNPKWPLETAIVLAYFVATQRRPIAYAAAAAPPLAMLAAALQATTFRELLFFGYRYPAAFYAWFRTGPIAYVFGDPFDLCSEWFWPVVAIPALVAFVIVWRKRALPIAALVVAGAIELRFLYSYPRLFPQYFVMWGCSLALLYGVTIAAAGKRWAGVAGVVVALCFAAVDGERIIDPVDEHHWDTKAALLQRLAPGEGVWVEPDDSPFVAPAGSYYWYAFRDQVPFSLDYARRARALPPLTENDLPPCRILNGLRRGDVVVRFLDTRAVAKLPRAKQCLDALIASNRVTRFNDEIWEVQRPPGSDPRRGTAAASGDRATAR